MTAAPVKAPARKEHWQYLGASVPRGFGEAVDSQHCYWFRRENIGTGGTTLIVAAAEYWNAATTFTGSEDRR